MKSNLLMTLSILLVASSASGGVEEWSLSWCELGPVVAGKKIRLELADGERVRGRALAVKGDSLRAIVAKSSDRKRHPPGESVFPRDTVREVRMLGNGYKGKVVGTVVGVVGGLFFATGVGYATGSWPAMAATWIGSGVGGFALGDVTDRKVTHIRLRTGDQQCPDPPDESEDHLKTAETAGPYAGETQQLIGVGGEPTYGAPKGERIDARAYAGNAALGWEYEQWSGDNPPPPAESRSDRGVIADGVSENNALR